MKPVSLCCVKLAVAMFSSPPYGVRGALVVMLIRKESAPSPPLSVQLTMTLIAPLTFAERSTQERVETEEGTVKKK